MSTTRALDQMAGGEVGRREAGWSLWCMRVGSPWCGWRRGAGWQRSGWGVFIWAQDVDVARQVQNSRATLSERARRSGDVEIYIIIIYLKTPLSPVTYYGIVGGQAGRALHGLTRRKGVTPSALSTMVTLTSARLFSPARSWTSARSAVSNFGSGVTWRNLSVLLLNLW